MANCRHFNGYYFHSLLNKLSCTNYWWSQQYNNNHNTLNTIKQQLYVIHALLQRVQTTVHLVNNNEGTEQNTVMLQQNSSYDKVHYHYLLKVNKRSLLSYDNITHQQIREHLPE